MSTTNAQHADVTMLACHIDNARALEAWRALPEERKQRVLEHLDGEAEMHERAARTYEGRDASPLARRGEVTARQRAADLQAARMALS